MIKKSVSLLVALFISLNVLGQKESVPLIDYNSIYHPEIGKEGMVVSQRRVASQVGSDILRRGGNAVDAAVATALALSVVLPRAGNLGGGGFMVIHLANKEKTLVIDYRERAPGKSTRDMFLDALGNYDENKARNSLLSAGVPGTVAGLAYALENYGSLSWAEVIDPAIKLAEEGFEVSHDFANILEIYKGKLTNNSATAKAYYKEEATPYLPGEIIKLPDLALSLKELREDGPRAFYTGEIANKIIAAMENGGGLITQDDLENYSVAVRKPVEGTYRGYKIISMPPSSSGGIHLIQMLNMLEEFPLEKMGFGSSESIHLLAEVMKRAFADRSKFLGDSDFVYVPEEGLLSKSYAKELNKTIKSFRATPSKQIKGGDPFRYESPDTTHFSVMDEAGNAVSNTYTLNSSFGSGIVIPGTGILMNNEMDDFSSKPGVPNQFGLVGAEANAIEANKRPLSSMTPTMVFKGEEPLLILGSPGGPRIITAVLQVIINVIDHKMNIAEAVSSPRLHHQWSPDILFSEKGFSVDTLKILEKKGHNLLQTRAMGSVQAILYEGEYFYGAADSRRPNSGAVAVSP